MRSRCQADIMCALAVSVVVALYPSLIQASPPPQNLVVTQLYPNETLPVPNQFGSSSSISGNTVALGSRRDNNFTGSAFVFVETAGTWSQQAKLTASDAALFGHSVGINADTTVIGAPNTDSGR